MLTIRHVLMFGIVVVLPLLGAEPANAQATYTLKPTPKTVAWGYYDARAAPVSGSKAELGGLCPAKRDIL